MALLTSFLVVLVSTFSVSAAAYEAILGSKGTLQVDVHGDSFHKPLLEQSSLLVVKERIKAAAAGYDLDLDKSVYDSGDTKGDTWRSKLSDKDKAQQELELAERQRVAQEKAKREAHARKWEQEASVEKAAQALMKDASVQALAVKMLTNRPDQLPGARGLMRRELEQEAPHMTLPAVEVDDLERTQWFGHHPALQDFGLNEAAQENEDNDHDASEKVPVDSGIEDDSNTLPGDPGGLADGGAGDGFPSDTRSWSQSHPMGDANKLQVDLNSGNAWVPQEASNPNGDSSENLLSDDDDSSSSTGSSEVIGGRIERPSSNDHSDKQGQHEQSFDKEERTKIDPVKTSVGTSAANGDGSEGQDPEGAGNSGRPSAANPDGSENSESDADNVDEPRRTEHASQSTGNSNGADDASSSTASDKASDNGDGSISHGADEASGTADGASSTSPHANTDAAGEARSSADEDSGSKSPSGVEAGADKAISTAGDKQRQHRIHELLDNEDRTDSNLVKTVKTTTTWPLVAQQGCSENPAADDFCGGNSGARSRAGADSGSKQSPSGIEGNYVVGQQVQRREAGKDWNIGYVTALTPLLVSVLNEPSTKGYRWDEVRPIEGHESSLTDSELKQFLQHSTAVANEAVLDEARADKAGDKPGADGASNFAGASDNFAGVIDNFAGVGASRDDITNGDDWLTSLLNNGLHGQSKSGSTTSIKAAAEGGSTSPDVEAPGDWSTEGKQQREVAGGNEPPPGDASFLEMPRGKIGKAKATERS